ncbi:MAG: PP2C family protein-serine/threonine phosphatase [bacterium]
MRILIAEDDQDTRLLLARILRKWGHEVIQAADGACAWGILQNDPVSFVISDWMMPNMDGLELCNKIRAANFSRYVYIMLLTAKDAKDELIEGMQAGADDFLVKPFNKGELNVRIRAGERILKLEHDLEERNKKLSEAYGTIRKDLEAAAKMQESLLPGAASSIQGIRFDWIFFPSTFVAGDIFNFFQLDESHVGFYLLDVAGHGIPSAMIAVTLSKMLTPASMQDSILKHYDPNSKACQIFPPAQVLKSLNQRFQNEQDAMQYFTMVYGVIDTRNERVRIGQAAHPSPILMRQGKKAAVIGDGGFPVGMFPDIEYETVAFDFHAGDRILLYSDGITECPNQDQELFSETRLMAFLNEHRELPLQELLQKLRQRLQVWHRTDEFEDDISILAIEHTLET